MPQNNKVVYPNWLSDPEIINQVLSEVITAGGKLQYSCIVNKTENNDSYERMRKIITKMRKEKLIRGPLIDDGFIEIDIEGGRAASMGYKKYHWIRRWDTHRRINRFFLFVSTILLLALIGFGVYLALHKPKIF